MPVLRPSGICASSVAKSLLTSPVQGGEADDPRWVGTIRRLARGEGLVAEAVVDIVEQAAVAGAQGGRGRRAFAAIEPPAAHPEGDQLARRRPPPGTGRGVGEGG